MKKLLIATSVLFALPAFAQDAPKMIDPPFYLLKVSPQDVNKIASAIGMMPYRDASQLIDNLRQQVLEQQAAAGKAQEAKPDANANDAQKK